MQSQVGPIPKTVRFLLLFQYIQLLGSCAKHKLASNQYIHNQSRLHIFQLNRYCVNSLNSFLARDQESKWHQLRKASETCESTTPKELARRHKAKGAIHARRLALAPTHICTLARTTSLPNAATTTATKTRAAQDLYGVPSVQVSLRDRECVCVCATARRRTSETAENRVRDIEKGGIQKFKRLPAPVLPRLVAIDTIAQQRTTFDRSTPGGPATGNRR